MCGLAGYSRADGAINLEPVLRSLEHRGPDGSGLFQDRDAGVGLAHLRLSIIDLNETGAQPMQNSAQGMVLSYNGEIYNHVALRRDLEARGHSFRGTSDTEVLLTLLESEGLEALHKLNGIFAFAIFDRSTGEVTVVRDAYGVKPLYYSAAEDGVHFASEIRGLTAMGVVAEAIDYKAVGQYLSFLWNPASSTIASNIRSLAPGEAIVLKGGKIARRWQWFTSPTLRPRPRNVGAADLMIETEGAIRAAVHRQMVADVPVGAFLSGGLDSSAVVAFAKEKSPDIRCFTIEAEGGPEDGMPDDLPYARQVAGHLNVPLDVVRVEPDRMASELEMMVDCLEEPLADPACLNVLYISRLAREQGITVLLSGSGGDDLFTGYRRHMAVRLDQHLSVLPKGLRRTLGRIRPLLNHSSSMQRRLAKFLNGIELDDDDRLINYFLWTGREDVLALLSDRVRDSLGDARFTAQLESYLELMDPDSAAMDKILAMEQRFFLAQHNLIYTDKMSMAASIEVRVPFLDLELVEFAATVPHAFKQKGRVGKWIFKKAMEPYLPHDVIYRPKAGFGAPLRRWLQGPLRELMQDLLSPDTLTRRGLFDASAVQRMIEDNLAGRRDASYTILSLMCIELWCRQQVDASKTTTKLMTNVV
ncbi:asparagine synthase (glutamine-hydrolyzing) [Pseudooceanicola sp.]|uniref:asparagine synthase (glutamine-hydrolyzing) n=1 Tax=Pseudooceanicola sp. TaxID=1914328 RepID=UPI0035C73992